VAAEELLPSDRSTWNLRQRTVWLAWLALLVLLPITSQPHLAKLIGGRPVNPPSLVPSLFILVAGVLPFWLRRGKIPRPAIPLLLFAAWALGTTALSPWLGLLPWGEVQVVERSVRGLATLAFGLSFFLAAMTLPLREDLLRDSLRAIAIGAVPALLWATLQPLQYSPIPLRDTMDAIHELLFSPRPLFRDRVTGMAVEPSWFANQLVLTYLPLWLAATVRRTSVFGRKPRWPSAETVLLLWGSLILLLTSSRSGFVAWGTVLFALAIGGGWAAGQRVLSRWLPGKGASVRRRGAPSRLAGPLGAGLAGVAVLALGVLAIVLSSRLDRRMERLFRLEFESEPGRTQPLWLSVATQLEYAERVTYWTAAARVFALHPVLGVGLGNSGFFFSEVIPAVSYELPDVLGAVGQIPGDFPNPKSLWFRVLAETGIVGFVLFLTWLIVGGLCAWAVARRARPLAAVVGVACLFSILAFGIEGFSLDTFALPYFWLLLGISTGLWARHRSGVSSA